MLDRFIIPISLGSFDNLGKVVNSRQKWLDFVERFRTPLRDDISHAEYLALPEEEKRRRKGAAGFFMGAPMRRGWRKTENALPRRLVTLDFDRNAGPVLDMLTGPLAEIGPLAGTAFLLHSTRSHTSEDPRFRLVIPTSRDIEPDEYPAISRLVAATIDPGMQAVDPSSFRVAQMMFMPTVSRDQEYLFHLADGEPLDVDELVGEFERKHGPLLSSPEHWPRAASETSPARLPSRKPENPLEKPAPVGTFCRFVGTIHDAIERYLSDYYAPTDDPNRYAWTKGSGFAGIVVYDDQWLYSFHATDPCSGRLCNAFDAVRLCLFGEKDETKLADADEEIPVTELPSYKAMLEWLNEDEEYQAFMRDEVLREMGQALGDGGLNDASSSSPPSPPPPPTGEDLLALAGDPDEPYGDADEKVEYISLEEDIPLTVAHKFAWLEVPGYLRTTGAVSEASFRVLLPQKLPDLARRRLAEPLLASAFERDWWRTWFWKRYPDRVPLPNPDRDDWMRQLEMRNVKGKVRVEPTDSNLWLILRNDPRFLPGLALYGEDEDKRFWMWRPLYDVKGRKLFDAPRPAFDTSPLAEIVDVFASILSAPLDKGGYGMTVSGSRIRQVMGGASERRADRHNDAILAWLKADLDDAAPDERLDTWFCDYLELPDTEYHRELGRCLMMAMAARQEVAVAFDIMPVLIGEQGCGKSTFTRLLSGEPVVLHTEAWSSMYERPKDFMEAAQHLVIEEAELAGLKKAQLEHVKRTISAPSVKARRAYARSVSASRVRAVFIGTTNEFSFLSDPTGERRFWPVTVGLGGGEVLDAPRLAEEWPWLLRAGYKAWQASGSPRRITPSERAREEQVQQARQATADLTEQYDADELDLRLAVEHVLSDIAPGDTLFGVDVAHQWQEAGLDEHYRPANLLRWIRAILPSRVAAEMLWGPNATKRPGWAQRLGLVLKWTQHATHRPQDFEQFLGLSTNRLKYAGMQVRAILNKRAFMFIPREPEPALLEFCKRTGWLPVLEVDNDAGEG